MLGLFQILKVGSKNFEIVFKLVFYIVCVSVQGISRILGLDIVCLFELIEELARLTNFKFGRGNTASNSL